MRTFLSTAALGVLCSLAVAPPAYADFGFEPNGPYRVASNGEWAKTNEVFNDEKVLVSTWTFRSTCADPHTCSGTVNSDQGWTAPLVYRGGRWIVDRD
jgi:hypothetical protein